MRYSDNRLNGHPSWPEFYDRLTASEERITQEIRISTEYLRDRQERDNLRVHERIDNSETILHRKIEDLREDVITLRVTPPPITPPSTRAARARQLAELIAPLRELVMIACVIAAGLAALFKAPEVKVALMEAVGTLERHGRTSD